MTTIEIITLLLSSSAIATILSSFINYLIQRNKSNNDFRNEYYKQIISKRFKAYEHVDQVIISLSGSSFMNGKAYPLIFNDRQNFIDKFSKLVFAISLGTWLSDETMKILVDINQKLLEADKEFNLSDSSDHILYRKAGTVYHASLINLKVLLQEQLKKDVRDLYNIKNLK